MIDKVTSYKDGGTIGVWMSVPLEYVELFDLPKRVSYEFCRDFRVGVKTSKCGGDVWLGYPDHTDSINLTAKSKYIPLVLWINERLIIHVKYLQQDINSFISAEIK